VDGCSSARRDRAGHALKRWRTIALALAAALLLISARSWSWSGASGVHEVIALFESHVHPDLPFDQFAAGRLGIIQPTWRLTYLYVAYRYLAGPGFNAGEQKALTAMWNVGLGLQLSEAETQWLDTTKGVNNETAINVEGALAQWLAARNVVPGVEVMQGLDVYRGAPSGSQFYFSNCNYDAFITAARTLGTMIRKFGSSSPQVKRWVDAQDQVFDNCSDTPPQFVEKPDAWFAAVDEWSKARNQVPGVGPPPSVDGSCKGAKFDAAANDLAAMIGKLGASNPQVKQWVDARDQALVECSRHPEPPRSGPDIPEPLQDGISFERAQRSYQIASANFYSGSYDTAASLFGAIAADSSSPWRQLAPFLVARATIRKATLSSDKNDHALLARAEAQLNDIVATTADESVKRAAQQLLGFVRAQLHLRERELELARAVMLPASGEILRQNVSDYLWIRGYGSATDNTPVDDLTDWITTLSGLGAGRNDELLAHAIAKWKTTALLPWLVAAIAETPATDPGAPALIVSAAKVKPDSPAFTTVAYHTARLLIAQGKADEGRAKLDALLARRDELPRSAVNQIAALRMGIARNLNELLVDAQRTPLGITDDADYNELPSEIDDQDLKAVAAGPFFDNDSAQILTRSLPLSALLQAAHSQTPPPHLRGPIALAAFVRAILLGKRSAERDLAPGVTESFPQLKPAIDRWLVAPDEPARRFAAAFMMLQNPGMSYYVDPGPGRITRLDQIDSMRDNWWPSRADRSKQPQTYPSFLTADQKQAADEEWASSRR
jgi:hypothetical protein